MIIPETILLICLTPSRTGVFGDFPVTVTLEAFLGRLAVFEVLTAYDAYAIDASVIPEAL